MAKTQREDCGLDPQDPADVDAHDRAERADWKHLSWVLAVMVAALASFSFLVNAVGYETFGWIAPAVAGAAALASVAALMLTIRTQQTRGSS
ncbi:hypothetical protein ACFVYG_32660 [Streptomyces sp. NPDC058256]|uniref:hypothetical protein n=1 Tax=Streptomyces sp. NPDC058256 TaxID=3346408 RepID=UPI0036E2172F